MSNLPANQKQLTVGTCEDCHAIHRPDDHVTKAAPTDVSIHLEFLEEALNTRKKNKVRSWKLTAELNRNKRLNSEEPLIAISITERTVAFVHTPRLWTLDKLQVT